VWNEGLEYFRGRIGGGKGGKGAWVVMAVVREVGEEESVGGRGGLSPKL